MADPTAKTEPPPPPAVTEPAPPPEGQPETLRPAPAADEGLFGGMPMVMMKGGTTSSRYDRERQRLEAQGKQGREHQDKQMQAANAGVMQTDQGLAIASMRSMNLQQQGAPLLVLQYLNADKSVHQECVSEVVIDADGDTSFVMVCPKCVARGEPMGLSQVMVRKSHRKFELDTRRAGELVKVESNGRPAMVRICGTVTVDDTIRCAGHLCDWTVKVIDSKVVKA